VNKPSIILADEPTGNLDTKTSEEIMKLFNDIHEEAIPLVTHEEEVAAYAHRIIRLRDGMIESDISK
jgi:putative ABC transport system ATP-binding protein